MGLGLCSAAQENFNINSFGGQQPPDQLGLLQMFRGRGCQNVPLQGELFCLVTVLYSQLASGPIGMLCRESRT